MDKYLTIQIYYIFIYKSHKNIYYILIIILIEDYYNISINYNNIKLLYISWE